MKIGFCLKHRVVAFGFAVALFGANASMHAQSKALITSAVDPSQRKVLHGSIHPLANSANDRGHADGAMAMKDMLLLLQPNATQTAQLKKYVDDLHNANSPRFHKWLTPEEFAARYGAADADVAKVKEWLAASGFSVDQVARGKNWIRFSGTSTQVETTFRTSIHSYSVNGETKYANATALSIPAALAPAVAGLVSANSFGSHPQHAPPSTIARDKTGRLRRIANPDAPQTAGAKLSPDFTSAGSQEQNFLAPADFAKIYNTQPLVSDGTDGTGISIAIVGRSDIEISDIEAFRTIAGLPFNDPNIIYATTDPGDVPGDDVEASLDVEWSGAIAPHAQIDYVIGASTTTTDGVDIAASYAVDNVTSPILSLSFGLCEANVSDTEMAFYQTLWQQAAVEGITVLVAAGDAGSSDCNAPENPETVQGFGVNGLASTAYTVAVGGTEFNESSLNAYWNVANSSELESVKGYIPEAVWNESCNGAIAPNFTNCNFAPYELGSFSGGGGASSCVTRTYDSDGDETCVAGYPKPSWQRGKGVPNDGVRDLPDVSLAAADEHDGFLLCIQGSCQWSANSDGSVTLEQAAIVGGTSASTPAMAGILALVEQKHGAFQGVANYQLYKIAAISGSSCDSSQRTNPTKTASCVFNDITAGSNTVACNSGSPNCDTAPSSALKEAAPAIVIPPHGAKVLDGYSATAGYDLASGLGSVNAANLVAAWGAETSAPSKTKLLLSKTSFEHGTPIRVTADVAAGSGSGTPSGDVYLKSSAVGALQTGALTSGKFSASTINLPGGKYSLTAQFSGDATYAASASSPVSVNVTPEPSVLTASTFVVSPFLILGQHKIVPGTATQLGNSFWVQVQVGGKSGSTGATGSIELKVLDRSIGTFPLDKTGSIYVPCGPETNCDLGIGGYMFTASYSGDASFDSATGTRALKIPFSIRKGLLDWETFVNNQTTTAGNTIIATTYFNNDPSVIPTGTITLTRSDTNAVLGHGLIDKTGVSTIAFIARAGTYNVNAAYSGDNHYIPGFQEISDQVIAGTAGTITPYLSLRLIARGVSLGQVTQYSARVIPPAGSTRTPIGTVTLYSATGQIAGSLTLSGGSAVGFVQWEQVGAQQVYASYSGDSNYRAANSTIENVTVAQAVPEVNVQTLSTAITAGSQTSVTASLSSPLASSNVQAPSGWIQFFDAVNGKAPKAIGARQGITGGNGGTLLATFAPTLAAGSHVITARYSGDANWKAATGTAPAPIVATVASSTTIKRPVAPVVASPAR